ncbi:uncharacterized protein [Littorina saxatilis]|uniref:uncharacterized protein isoform X9 n=1 Tax=Littorina saxatilis TaxID=31220 RepID=UPI0038B65FAA
MDVDSSSKFIGSLTKFLQSLCNGYVEFQRGVELVGHIYLSIDTGEKVDYILHEKVSKNDENSVTFVSNSFHAQPLDKDKAVADKESLIKFGAKGSEDASGDDSDDIMILDQSKGVPGSTNAGTIPFKGTKRVASPSSDQRRLAQRGYAGPVRNQGSSNPMSPPRNRQLSGPSATVTSHGGQSENINVGDMKLEQITTDELLSLASQVGEGASSSNLPPRGPVRVGRSSLGDAAGQPVWIKQEPPDDRQGGPDTGWSHSRDGQSDSSNSGSNLYPVMMHPNASAYSSNPVFPGFPSMSGPSATATSQHHGLSQPLPGTSGANPYANLMPGTSGSVDPAELRARFLDPYRPQPQPWLSEATRSKRQWQSVKGDPRKHQRNKLQNREAARKYRTKIRMENQMLMGGLSLLQQQDNQGEQPQQQQQGEQPQH